jgi:hypothetical protein
MNAMFNTNTFVYTAPTVSNLTQQYVYMNTWYFVDSATPEMGGVELGLHPFFWAS